MVAEGSALYCSRMQHQPDQVVPRGKSIRSLLLNSSHWDIQTWCHNVALFYYLIMYIGHGQFISVFWLHLILIQFSHTLRSLATWIESVAAWKFRHCWIFCSSSLALAGTTISQWSDCWSLTSDFLGGSANHFGLWLHHNVIYFGRIDPSGTGHGLNSNLWMISEGWWNSSSKQPMHGQTRGSPRYTPRQTLCIIYSTRRRESTARNRKPHAQPKVDACT